MAKWLSRLRNGCQFNINHEQGEINSQIQCEKAGRARRDTDSEYCVHDTDTEYRYRYYQFQQFTDPVSQAWYSTGPNDGILGIHWPFGWHSCLNLGAPITVSETRSKTKRFPGTDHQQTRQRIVGRVGRGKGKHIRKPMGFFRAPIRGDTSNLCPSVSKGWSWYIMIHSAEIAGWFYLMFYYIILYLLIMCIYIIYIYKYPQFSQFFMSHV